MESSTFCHNAEAMAAAPIGGIEEDTSKCSTSPQTYGEKEDSEIGDEAADTTVKKIFSGNAKGAPDKNSNSAEGGVDENYFEKGIERIATAAPHDDPKVSLRCPGIEMTMI